MKKIILLSLFACYWNISCFAQLNTNKGQINKPFIDSSVFGKLRQNDLSCQVSNDGRYAIFYHNAYPYVPFGVLSIKNTANGHETDIENFNLNISPEFSGDGKQLYFVSGKDSLFEFDLHKGGRKFILKISEFDLVNVEKDEWLVYKCDTPVNTLHIINKRSGKERIISNVTSFETKASQGLPILVYLENTQNRLHVLNLKKQQETIFADEKAYVWSPKKQILLVQSNDNKLEWLNLSSGYRKTVCENIPTSNYAFDAKEEQLAFANQQSNKHEIWYFKESSGKAITIIEDKDLKAKIAVNVIGKLQFNHGGNRLALQFRVQRGDQISNKNTVNSNVIVWNYKDQKLASAPQEQSEPVWAVVNVLSHKIDIVTQKKEDIQFDNEDFNDYLFVVENQTRPLDSYYNPDHYKALSLIDLRNGKRQLLFRRRLFELPSFSPNDRYLVWFDPDSLNWLSYEIATGTKRNISKSIPFPVVDEHQVELGSYKSLRANQSYGLAAWKQSGDALYLYDRYDLWEIDPKGQRAPVSITNGAGRKDKVVLGLLNLNKPGKIPVIHAGHDLLLSAYSPYTKESGFWRIQLNSKQDPIRGTMKPFAMYRDLQAQRTGLIEDAHSIAGGIGHILKKIGTTDKFLVSMESADQFPNYYFTDDFIHYRRLTDFQPQAKYNWMTAELINWSVTNQVSAQGILYKPENFNPSKKYPIIFCYYDHSSEGFHNFLEPDYSGARMNIPYFVSNGYLVFVPDIYYREQGHNARWVTNSVVSAAKYLSKLPYVDSTKMGLQGHSHGGEETNSIVTHTQNLFAAACTAAGHSDLVTDFNYTDKYIGQDQQYFLEAEWQGTTYGIGTTPYNRADLYMENSPVFFADRVSTPLLIMHGDLDEAVPFNQGMEMYRALTRAGKKVWLLEYPQGGHDLGGSNDEKDFTIRMKQFFDHYLKGAPAPRWMTVARDVYGWKPETGYELEEPNKN